MATKSKYDPESDDGQGFLDRAAKELAQADEMNFRAGEVLLSGTGNKSAAETYRKVASERLKRAQDLRRQWREFRATKGLKKAFD